MEFFKSVWGFFTDPQSLAYLEAGLAILGGFSVLAKLTKTTVDDKIFAVLTWPMRKAYEALKGKQG